MTFVPENDLERALLKAPTDESARPEFYRLLLESELLTLGEIAAGGAPSNAPVEVGRSTSMRLSTARRNGRDYILLFSAPSRLNAFAKRQEPYLTLKGRDLFENTRGAYYLLNPGAEHGKELLPDEIAALLPPRAETQDSGGQRLLSQPREQPSALQQALRAYFATRPDIETAYMAQISGVPGHVPHPVLGVETTGPWAEVAAGIGEVFDKGRFGVTIDLVPIDRDAPDGSVNRTLLRFEPFYSRAKARD